MGDVLSVARADAAATEFVLTDEDFEAIRRLIRARAGIQLSDAKRSMVYNRLVRRLRETGAQSFRQYLAMLDRGDEFQSFVNALTTNLTSFFREGYHFPILADFLKQRAAQSRKVSIWCAASSTGEEPYSIAMTVVDALGARPPVSIVASDIDTEVLRTAARGAYPAEAAEKLDEAMLRRHFLRGKGSNAGLIRVRPEVAGLVEFRQVNLIDDRWPFQDKFDVIFCRNVMIYFDRDTKMRIVTEMHKVMRDDGLLFVGHSENFNECRDLFKLQGRTVYRRLGVER